MEIALKYHHPAEHAYEWRFEQITQWPQHTFGRSLQDIVITVYLEVDGRRRYLRVDDLDKSLREGMERLLGDIARPLVTQKREEKIL